jgi:uncharacterized protein with HEPN domain
MPNIEIIHDRLILILESINLILERSERIKIAGDFVKDKDGIELMDSIAMRLQMIGENAKRIAKEQEDFFETKLHLDPDPIIRFRDFISHHYEKTDYEIIFDICTHHIIIMKKQIDEYLELN